MEPQNGQDEASGEADAAIKQLERILASRDFDASRKDRALLRFLLAEALAGRSQALNEITIAMHVFGRGNDLDPIVRIQVGRLRRSLERYYRESRTDDVVRIELPRGTYVPVVRRLGVQAAK